jgi:hypothetical protein
MDREMAWNRGQLRRHTGTLLVFAQLLLACKTEESQGPQARLTVVVGPGVVANPNAGTVMVPVNSEVAYSFSAKSGFERVHAILDSSAVGVVGTVLMSTDHVLYAAADTIIVSTAQQTASIQKLRAVLSSADPEEAFKVFVQGAYDESRLLPAGATSPTIDALRRSAFDPQSDAAELQRVQRVFNGEMMDLDFGSPNSGASQSQSLLADATLPVRIIFINGIWTDLSEAVDDIIGIRKVVDGASIPNFSRPPNSLRLFYNATTSERPQTSTFCRIAAMRQAWSRLFEPFSVWLYTELKCGQINDAFRALDDINRVIADETTISDEAAALADSIVASRRLGRAVLLVGHSQGTLIAQQALRRVYGSNDPNSDVQKCTGLISIAGPVYNPFPIRHVTSFYVKGSATEDLITLWPSAAGGPGTRTSLSDKTDALFQKLKTDMPKLEPVWHVALDLPLHNLLTSYIGDQGEPIRSDIQKTFRDQVAAIRGDCAPQPTSLSIIAQPGGGISGDVLNPQPVIEIRDNNGFRVGSASTVVTASLVGSGGQLSGTTAVASVNGVATFSNLRVVGSGIFRLTFSATSLATVSSSSFEMGSPTCTATAVTLPFSVSGTLLQWPCELHNRTAKGFSFSVNSQSALQLIAGASGFSPFVTLRDGQGRGSFTIHTTTGTSLTTKWIVGSGNYTASIGNYVGSNGAFTFSGSRISEDTQNCQSTVLLQPPIIETSQSLTSSDCVYGSGQADLYSVGGNAICTITMRSTAFDAYLEVYSQNGTLLAKDDNSAGGLNARITIAPCYDGSDSDFIFGLRAYAFSKTPGARGTYTLSIEFRPLSSVRDGKDEKTVLVSQ